MIRAGKKMGSLVLVGLALTLIATSCGGETKPAFTSGELLIWADDTRTPVLRPFAQQFMTDNPGVTVEVVEVVAADNFGDLDDMLIRSAPAGEGPDIIIGAHDWLGPLTEAGVVEPMDLGGVEDQLADVAVMAFTYEGQVYGLPYAIENIALLRNTELVPTAPATFEDLEEVALGLLEEGKVEIALAMQVPDPYHQQPLFTAAGGYIFAQAPDGTYDPDDIGIDSEAGLRAADKFGEWTGSGLINPNVDYNVMIEMFGTGKAPFAITGPWAIAQADTGFKATGVPYVVEPIPPVDGQKPRPFVGVQGFMISSFSQQKLMAQSFLLDYMATEDAQYKLFEAGGRPPAHEAAFERASTDPDIQGFGLSGVDGQPMPAIPQMGSVWTAFTDGYRLIFTEKAEPRKAFQDAARQIRNLIEG